MRNVLSRLAVVCAFLILGILAWEGSVIRNLGEIFEGERVGHLKLIIMVGGFASTLGVIGWVVFLVQEWALRGVLRGLIEEAAEAHKKGDLSRCNAYLRSIIEMWNRVGGYSPRQLDGLSPKFIAHFFRLACLDPQEAVFAWERDLVAKHHALNPALTSPRPPVQSA